MRGAAFEALDRRDVPADAFDEVRRQCARLGLMGKELIAGPAGRRGLHGRRVPDHELPQYYLDIWTEMFREFLGWSEEETIRWASRWTDERGVDPLEDPEDIFYHETPQYWAIDLLIPDACKDRLSHGELLDLRQRILGALWDGHRGEFPRGTNWRPYRERVERILAEYGASLPTRQRVPWPAR